MGIYTDFHAVIRLGSHAKVNRLVYLCFCCLGVDLEYDPRGFVSHMSVGWHSLSLYIKGGV